jgi:hypothetical protein
MYGCVYIYVVHTLNSVTKNSNTQLPEDLRIDFVFKPRRIEKKKKIDVNFYLNVRFRICMSLIPLQATCHFTLNKSGYTFPFVHTFFT